MDILMAFLVGGALCLMGQLLIDLTKLTPARILTAFVVSGVVLYAMGIYAPLKKFAGCGAGVPLTGFGALMAEGVEKAVEDDGFLGIFTGALTAGAGGLAAAMICAFGVSLVFRSSDRS